MTNNHRGFSGDLLPPEAIRKGIYELGKVDRIPPAVGIFDSPTRCFVVNVEWWSHIAGMVHLLADVVSWRDADDESYFAITEILKFMQGMECMDFALRQKPDDSCIMQQTLDGGTTWTDVFDFSQCVTIQDKSYQISIQNQVANVQETFIDIYNNYTANYAGLPSDVYPALEQPAAGADDSALKAALCNAIWELIRTACNAAVSYYTETINSAQGEFNFLVGVAAFALTAIALAAAVPTAGASLVALGGVAPLIAAGVGLGAGLVNYLTDFWQQHTIDQFQDTEAMEEVACYLVDELAAGDKSLAEFQAALVGHGLAGNAGVIADYLAILLSNDSTYAAFLEKWDNNLQYAGAGIDLYCPCATEYKVWSWDFSNGLGPWTILNHLYDPFNPLGEISGGRLQGSIAVQPGITPDQKAIWVALNGFNPAWRVRSAKMYTEQVDAEVPGAFGTYQMLMRPTPGSDVGATGLLGGSGVTNGENVFCSTQPFYVDSANQLFIGLTCNHTGSESSQIYLDRVEIMFEADYAKGGYTTDDDDLCV